MEVDETLKDNSGNQTLRLQAVGGKRKQMVLTVVLKRAAAVDTSESVQIRSGISIAWETVSSA